jgi:hypothetical protein
MHEIRHLKLLWIVRFIAIIMLAVAFLHIPYGYYTLLRVVLTSIFIYLTYICYITDKFILKYIFILFAIIYNPLVPLHLGREVWTIINIATFVPIVISMLIVTKKDF